MVRTKQTARPTRTTTVPKKSTASSRTKKVPNPSPAKPTYKFTEDELRDLIQSSISQMTTSIVQDIIKGVEDLQN